MSQMITLIKRYRDLILIIIAAGVVYTGYISVKEYFRNQITEQAELTHTLAVLEESIAKTQQDLSALRSEIDGTVKSSQAESLRLSQDLEAERQSRLESESDLRVSVEKAKAQDVSVVVNEWRPRIAHITCRWSGGQIAVGSGLFLGMIDGVYKVETNRHVVYNDDTEATPASCSVKLPEDNATPASELKINTGSIDSATIYINEPTPKMVQLANSVLGKACSAKGQVGDQVVVLGYPAIGSPKDITATDGIISGYEGNYYITSAKIEQGNSGGIGVLLKNNCLLGIPTLTRVGRIEALGRILDWQVVRVN